MKTQVPFADPYKLSLKRRPHAVAPIQATLRCILRDDTPLAPTPTAGDFEKLREAEENLRKYEMRLQQWQDQLETAVGLLGPGGASSAPFAPASHGILADEWDKLFRARAILETEQNLVRDERQQMKVERDLVARREQEVAAREARVAEVEEKRLALAAEAAAAECAAQGKSGGTMFRRLSHTPFEVARQVFGAKKPGGA